MRPLPLGSSFLVTVAICVSAWGIRASGTGITSRAEGECLETVAVVAVLTHLVHDLGDDELSQRLAGEGPEGLVEGAVYLDDAAHTQTRHTALGGDVVALRRLGDCLRRM